MSSGLPLKRYRILLICIPADKHPSASSLVSRIGKDESVFILYQWSFMLHVHSILVMAMDTSIFLSIRWQGRNLIFYYSIGHCPSLVNI